MLDLKNMNLWKCRGTSKPFWIIAIIFVIFLIGGIIFLIIPATPTEVPTVPPPTPTKIVKTRPPTKLSVININSISTHYEKCCEYCIDDIALKVKNDGHPPAHISRVDIGINTKKNDFAFIPKKEGLISPGETSTITIPFKHFCHLKKGKYTASIKLKEGPPGERETVVTYKAKISIP